MKSLISFDSFKSFIDHQLKPHPHDELTPPKPFVTISRQAGAGGTAVSECLVAYFAKRANTGSWTVFDKSLAEKVAEDSALPRRIATYVSENTRNFIESTVEELLGLHPPIETLIAQTARTILNLAEMGNVIIVGRGGAWITARLPQGFHVRLVGSVETRTKHLAELNGLTYREATNLLHVLDQGRRAYAKKYCHADPDDPMLYHLMINTDRVSYEHAAEIIGQQVLKLLPQTARLRSPYVKSSN